MATIAGACLDHSTFFKRYVTVKSDVNEEDEPSDEIKDINKPTTTDKGMYLPTPSQSLDLTPTVESNSSS